MSSAATISRGARWFVLAGAAFLVLCTGAALTEQPRGTVVALGLHGFVFHTLFGKAYSLVPSYFDRSLAAPRAPQVQFPLAATGALGLALPADWWLHDALPVDPGAAGTVLWALGAGVFLATLAWTLRDNLTGAETGTGESKAHRARVDRIANAAMPVALAFLALGAYETAALGIGASALAVDVPSLTGSGPGASHLLAVGTASLLVFAIGARLLPRLLRATPPTWLVAVVLAGGVAGPLLLVGWFGGRAADGLVGTSIPDTPLLHGAIGTLVVAVLGHAVIVGLLVRDAPAPRLGAYGVLAGAIGGVVTVVAGALVGLGDRPELVVVHPRLGLIGFLGLTILGVAYHFYPPAIVGDWGDRVAAASIGLLGGGLALETAAVLADAEDAIDAGLAVDAGRVLAVGGALAYAVLLAATFRTRAQRH